MCSRSSPRPDSRDANDWGRLERFIRAELVRGRRVRPDAAADLTQDVLLALVRKVRPGETPDDLRGLAVVVARRAAAQWLRRRKRERLWHEWFAEALAAPVEDDFARDLQEALRLMAGGTRAALQLVYVDGRSHREAAGELGLPPNRFRKLMAEGRGVLKRVWDVREGDFLTRRAR